MASRLFSTPVLSHPISYVIPVVSKGDIIGLISSLDSEMKMSLPVTFNFSTTQQAPPYLLFLV